MPARILLNGRVLIAFVMFAIFVAMVAVALGYPAQARFMPLVVGVPGIAFTLLELIREVRHAARATDAEVAEENSERIALPEEVSRLIGTGAIDVPAETEHFTPDELQRREWILLGYFTAMIAGLIVFGFWIVAPLFVAVFLREREKVKWTTALAGGAAVLAVLYFVFERGLGIDLYPGVATQAALDFLFPIE